jgi:hypothetical protein
MALFSALLLLAVLSLGGVLAAAPAEAADDLYDGGWHFSLMPYIWLPNVNTKLRFDNLPPGQGSTADSESDSGGLLQHLDFALMFSAEARNGRWAILTDFAYVDFSKEDSSLTSVTGGGRLPIARQQNVDTNLSLTGFIWTLAGSYTALRTESFTLDVVGGARYLFVRAELEYDVGVTLTGPGFTLQRSGTLAREAHIVDGIVGARGIWKFGRTPLFISYYADVGAGTSDLTWQAIVGLGYAFSWGDIRLAYRHLSYEQSGDRMVRELRLSGPAFGVNFRF